MFHEVLAGSAFALGDGRIASLVGVNMVVFYLFPPYQELK